MKVGWSVILAGSVLLLAQGRYAETKDKKFDKMIQVIQNFSLNLFQEMVLWRYEKRQYVNEVVSPFSLWTALIMIYEGAGGETLEQLRRVLGISVKEDDLKEFYDETRELRDTDSDEMEIHSWQQLYHNKQYTIEPRYNDVVYFYDMGPNRKDFENFVGVIKDDIRFGTNFYIEPALQRHNIVEARMLLISAIYFIGKWKYPFDRELTKVEPFYNEKSPYKQLAKVPMMVQTNKFTYVDDIEGLDARVLELPYGEEGTAVMLVMLPNRGVTLNSVLENLKEKGLRLVLDAVGNTSSKKDVEVKIPKFNTFSSYLLPKFLAEIGIRKSVSGTANFTFMTEGPSDINMYLSHAFHYSRIIVDESGAPDTKPSPPPANKTGVVEFHMNKPFFYLILEKQMNLILFAGTIRNRA
ncbi:serine protease inhibitor 77Ba [Drosophila biarmipes]|uniref:serine protease inhibitor 77Ba n=1 Tax=Drosophila biarmipes TaxID=125945 RepID=UPI0007E674AF|nr:serine protease inhibitor 77Ba [Drosophila biarmipes]